MSTNERLRGALLESRTSTADLAERLQVDPKTVERWVTTGRVPHRAHRLKVAQELGADDAYLWPATAADRRNASASQAEVVEVYQNRSAIPIDFWVDRLRNAQENIDILTIAGTFLHDSVPDTVQILRERMDAGVQMRLLLADPDGETVIRRGQEEKLGNAVRSRCELTWSCFEPLFDHPGLSVRAHDTTLYCSMFRFDDDLVTNHHLYGAPGAQAPAMHLRRVPGGRLFLNHMLSYDRVWDLAYPRP